MFCNQCGQKIPDNSKFCNFCGAQVDNLVNKVEGTPSIETPVDYAELQRNARKGTLVYLQDVLAMEFCVNKLEYLLNTKKSCVAIHDEWFFWKRFRFQRPILTGPVSNEFDQPYIGMYLSYSYKLNKYYFMFDEGESPDFYDASGNKVNHQYGNPCFSYLHYRKRILDESTREKLCTPPRLGKKIFSSDYIILNSDSTYWTNTWTVVPNRNQLEVFDQIRPIVEQFERMVREREEQYQKELPTLTAEIEGISKELTEAKEILSTLYGVNMIPTKYRNIGCAYFIYDFFSSSNVPLDNVFLHLDMDKIQSQLDTVISNQGEMILQQAVIIAQNEDILSQNQKLFDELSSMDKTVSATLSNIQDASYETREWARIGALNAEANKWIGLANYLKK